jgi:energy-coupling factor transporter transmembrane protein EcfT
MRIAAQRWIAHIGSMRTTLVLLALLLATVLLRPAWWPLTLVFAALALNLVAALIRHPLLRRQMALLVFHLALLGLLLLVGTGRLSALDGRFELTQGVPFDGRLIDSDAGPLYVQRLQRLSFRHEGFEIDYAPGRRRGATRNSVNWTDAGGIARQAAIGDHRPLIIDGHRFYTSPNKGFAPLMRWQPAQGEAVIGAVHLPSYPVHELRQSREWALPDGRTLWVMLDIDEALIPSDAATRFRLPERHRLVVRSGELRAELTPGESLALPGGTLRYEGLRTWMGYRVSYDPTLPWLLAAALLAALSLAAHYTLKFDLLTRRRAWRGDALGAHDG